MTDIAKLTRESPTFSFWDMTTLAVAGRLASCESCLEYWYLQSEHNAVCFLHACVEAGLVEQVSLLDLAGDVGPKTDPSRSQALYDQPIFLSAPVFRSRDPDFFRHRTELAKAHVWEAYTLYADVGRDDRAIGIAYDRAARENKLRNPRLVELRRDVALSAVAKLRRILDGFGKDKSKSRETALRETREFILACAGSASASAAEKQTSDHAEEIDAFIEEFLTKKYAIDVLWDTKEYGQIPSHAWADWMSVVAELSMRRFRCLVDHHGSDAAERFSAAYQRLLGSAVEQQAREPSRVDQLRAVLADFRAVAAPAAV